MSNNKAWIQQQMREGAEIIDIGPYVKRRESAGASPFYEMEREEVEKRGYSNYTWSPQP